MARAMAETNLPSYILLSGVPPDPIEYIALIIVTINASENQKCCAFAGRLVLTLVGSSERSV
jgi:hypothetical protein